MQLDLQQLISRIEQICNIHPVPHKAYVENYIKAYYLPESSFEQWIQQHSVCFFFPFRFFFRGYLKKYIKANSCIHSSKIIIMAYFYTFAITSFWSIFVISLKKCSQNCNRKMIGNWKYISGDINI